MPYNPAWHQTESAESFFVCLSQQRRRRGKHIKLQPPPAYPRRHLSFLGHILSTKALPVTTSYPSTMPRPMHSDTLTFKSAAHYYQHRPSHIIPSDPADISLLSTIVLVATLLFCAAFFIATLGCLLANEHDVVTMYAPPSDGAQALIWAVKQSTRGCGGTC
ncbi:hypothetical protein BC835DRAFT_1058991 [Cytidiella melzeri]|nr:hypothetical protein BC835DRAFT_1058991 [Cytidiella melzeri]